MPQTNLPGPNSRLVAFAALNGFLAVAAGAFAAHGMDDPVPKEWLRTGAQYQMVHAVAALTVVTRSRVAGWLFNLGALVFAATLYAMAFGAPRMLGMVTPLGGTLLLAGWVALPVFAIRSARRPENS